MSGIVLRGKVRKHSYATKRPSKYDDIFEKLLKFDSKGGSIEENPYVEELCKLQGIKNCPKIIHEPGVGPKDSQGRVTYGTYDPNTNVIVVYDGSHEGICEYADTYAHEIQHASDNEKGVPITEPIAYREGEEASYACGKQEEAVFNKQASKDSEFSSAFGVYNCSNSYSISCVDVDSNDLERLKRILRSSADRLEEIRNAIERRFSEIAIDWKDNKYDEFSRFHRDVCNPKLQEMIQEMNDFVNYLNKKIEKLLRYQNNRIPIG